MNFLVFFFITTVVAEWELPFEINVNFLKHIGGFSPLLNSTYVPKKNFLPDRETLQPLTGNRSILLGSSSSSCEWNCFDSSFFPSPLPIEIDPVNASSECPPYTPNEPIIPPIRLPSINADGSCSSFDHHILSHTNVSLSCFIPFRGLPIDPLKCDLVDTVLLSFWSQLDLPDALCNCDRCTVPLVELNSTRNETDSACYITTGIEISITHREGKINSFILSQSEILLFDSSLTQLRARINVRFYDYHPPSENPRFWSRRHRFWCPSEISCLGEIWYPLSLLPPLSPQSIILCFIAAFIIFIVLIRIFRSSPNPSDESRVKRIEKTPY